MHLRKLVASHIIPWAHNEKERLNPENGLCLSSLYDRAYDRGLIGITADHKVVLAPKLQLRFTGRYVPKKEFLEYHLDEVFDYAK